MTARLYSSDEVEYFAYLRSIYFDRDVSFENEYRYFYDRGVARGAGFHETFLERETRVGLRVNYATIGAAFLWAPFYAVADGWTRITGTAEANGMTAPYIRAVAFGSAIYGFIAVLLSMRAARILLGQRGAFAAALAVWAGTPLLFYMYVAPPFSHACSAFTVAVFVNLWLRVRRDWSLRGALALGVWGGLMAMVREQDAFLALGPSVDFLAGSLAIGAAGLGRRVTAALMGAIGFAIGFTPQLLAYKALNGFFGPAEHVSRKMAWYSPHGLQVLASPHHGFVFWTPLAIPAIAGLIVLAMRGLDRDLRVIGWCLLLMVASQIYVAGSVESWTVAGAFGQRRFVCLTALLVIGLTVLLGRLRLPSFDSAARGVGTVAIGLLVYWNLALMAQFATRLMDRQRLEPARNAYTAFVALPVALPSLIYRYVFDRASFYEPAEPR